jgi:hypothetical protein
MWYSNTETRIDTFYFINVYSAELWLLGMILSLVTEIFHQAKLTLVKISNKSTNMVFNLCLITKEQLNLKWVKRSLKIRRKNVEVIYPAEVFLDSFVFHYISFFLFNFLCYFDFIFPSDSFKLQQFKPHPVLLDSKFIHKLTRNFIFMISIKKQ